jgi:hydrogenase nickel incorporation protein HypA/HybF
MLMHEAMVANSLLEKISKEAAKQNAKPISAKISYGKLYTINDEALCFAFQAIATGTICESIKLQIEHKPIQAHCTNCNLDFNVEFSKPVCPNCGGNNFKLLPDAPLMLEEIEFQEG